MLKVFPFGSGSHVTMSWAVSSSHANSANKLSYVVSSSTAGSVISPTSGSRGSPDVCLITYADYVYLSTTPGSYEICNFN